MHAWHPEFSRGHFLGSTRELLWEPTFDSHLYLGGKPGVFGTDLGHETVLQDASAVAGDHAGQVAQLALARCEGDLAGKALSQWQQRHLVLADAALEQTQRCGDGAADGTGHG